MIPSIDAGNSRFKCAVADVAGNPKLITNRFSESFTPSAVFFSTDGSTIVGTEAINAGFVEPARLVSNWKRAMGTDEILYTADDGTVYHAEDVLTIFQGITEICINFRIIIEQFVICYWRWFNEILFK